MEIAIDFLSQNWETISALCLWVVVRVLPTQKNYDVFEMALNLIGKLIPNRRKDSLGNPKK